MSERLVPMIGGPKDGIHTSWVNNPVGYELKQVVVNGKKLIFFLHTSYGDPSIEELMEVLLDGYRNDNITTWTKETKMEDKLNTPRIMPIIGRVVWFHPHENDNEPAHSDQPLAAIITYVHSDTMINLVVFDQNGNSHGRCSVYLWDGEPETQVQGGNAYAEWMPYQKGQAAKAQELEAQLKNKEAS